MSESVPCSLSKPKIYCCTFMLHNFAMAVIKAFVWIIQSKICYINQLSNFLVH